MAELPGLVLVENLVEGDAPVGRDRDDHVAPLHLGATDPQGIAFAAKAVLRQAQNIGYTDSFWFATLNFVAMLPLLLLVRTPKKAAVGPVPVSAE